jgi:hypothetical protein
MVMTETAGAHPIIAFTLANAAILGAALWASARVFGPVIALLILATPVIWFVARAQVEVFTVALLSLAMAAAATGRWGWASIAVATASTQNAPIAVAVPLFWIAALVDWRFSQRSAGHSIRPTRRQTWRALGFVLGGVVLAFLHPLYYVLRLGVLTPQQLNGGIAGKVPSLAAVLAPVVDPDIGFVAWMPVGACLALVGLCLTARRAREMLAEQRHLVMATALSVVVGLWLLAVVTQTTNVNSGGTVHISRYALWFLPLTAPAMTVAVGAIEARSSLMLPVASTALFLLNLGYFRPSQPEQYVTHSPQADWLMTHLPAPYRPVPEIFVERTLHIDGGATASAASPDCRLILVLASAPSQPCPLTETDSAAMARHFGAGDTAVWLRGTIGERSVSTAIAGP